MSVSTPPRPAQEDPAFHGLTRDEYQRVGEILGRKPNVTEMGIFGVMWSEHCSYKTSKVHLKKLPTKSDRVLVGPGENAGIIDIGGGWAIAFKIESHNHPSFIDPFQGAATGVGGILRDIAGILNKERNVLGMMPHPERAMDPLMGSTDGLGILRSMAAAVEAGAILS